MFEKLPLPVEDAKDEAERAEESDKAGFDSTRRIVGNAKLAAEPGLALGINGELVVSDSVPVVS